MKRRLICVLLVMLMGFQTSFITNADTNTENSGISYSDEGYVRVPLNRGMNFTCYEMVEYRPTEYVLEERYYRMVQSRGFDHIRLPVNFSLYCDSQYNISEEIFEKVDKAISLAIAAGLYVVLDMHGCGDINSNADDGSKMLYALWEQVAEHYKDYNEKLIFELLNEPNTGTADAVCPLDADRLNEIQNEIITRIRRSNPDRVLVAAVADNNIVWNLEKLSLPKDDKNIIATVHIYTPMEFTHQGVTWSSSSNYPKCDWRDTFQQDIENAVKIASDYQKNTGRQVWVGEFGTCLNVADEEDVISYLVTTRRLFENNGLGWCYWEFWMSFGAYDRYNGMWKEYVVNSLIPVSGERLDIAFAKESDLCPRNDAVDSYNITYGNAYYDGKEQSAARFELKNSATQKNISFTTRNAQNDWKTWDFNDYPNAVLRLWLKSEKAITVNISVQQTSPYTSYTVSVNVSNEDCGRWKAYDFPVSQFFEMGMTERFNVMFINPTDLYGAESIYIGNLEYWSSAPQAPVYDYSEPMYGYAKYYPYKTDNYSVSSSTEKVAGADISVKKFTATESGEADFSGGIISNSIIKYEIYADSSVFTDCPDGFFSVYVNVPKVVDACISIEDSSYARTVLYENYKIEPTNGLVRIKIPASRLFGFSGRVLYLYIGRSSAATSKNGKWLSKGEYITLSALHFFEQANNFDFDINGDCKVDIIDLIREKKLMASADNLADVNLNGEVDSRDIVLLRRRLLSK